MRTTDDALASFSNAASHRFFFGFFLGCPIVEQEAFSIAEITNTVT
jgi:hypothetical protein